jgi:hypothetical protein
MSRKVPLQDYEETVFHLQGIILSASIEARVLLRHLRDLRREVAKANRYGTTINFAQYLNEFLGTGSAVSLQQLTRQVNDARKIVANFLEKNKGAGL